MPKYRLLSKEELVQFEKEFIEYLVVNGITGDDWAKMKKEDKAKAEQITDLFSDIVFEKIMREVQFLTFRSSKKLLCFQCLKDEIILVGVDAIENSSTNFMTQTEYTNKDQIKVYTQTKKYSKIRELELFEMTQNGCEIDDGKLFKQLCLSL